MKSPEPIIAESGPDTRRLLHAISRSVSDYIDEANPFVLFNGLLGDLLELTGSEYGFIGEVFTSGDGQPYLRSYATTNIAWSSETRALYAKAEKRGMVFAKLDSLYGEVLRTHRPVIANRPADDPRSGGLPPGHPALACFLGLPILAKGDLLGMVGIANRAGGYSASLVDYLAPFLATCGNLIQAYRNNLRRVQAEDELRRMRDRRSLADAAPPGRALGHGYRLDPARRCVMRNGRSIRLTRKEWLLFDLLLGSRGQVVEHHRIDARVWPTAVVGASSTRALVLRLRRKLAGLEIRSLPGVGYMLTESIGPDR